MGAVLRVRLEIWEVEPTRHEGERGEKPGMPFGPPVTLGCLRIWEEEASGEPRSVIVDGLGLRWPRNGGDSWIHALGVSGERLELRHEGAVSPRKPHEAQPWVMLGREQGR